jgi:hypothetical protein
MFCKAIGRYAQSLKEVSPQITAAALEFPCALRLTWNWLKITMLIDGARGRAKRVPLTAASASNSSPPPLAPLVFIHRCEQQQWFNNQREASPRGALCALIDIVKEMFTIVRRTKKILLPSSGSARRRRLAFAFLLREE